MLSWAVSEKRFEFTAVSILTGIICLMAFTFPNPDLAGPMNHTFGWVLDKFSFSAGSKGFLITTALLCLLPLMRRFPFAKMLSAYVQFGILLVLAFVLKTGMKQMTEVPRPYTEQLTELNLIPKPEAFYELNDSDKESLLEIAAPKIDSWRMKQWQGETNYSLPSGHTIFAAVAVLFWGGFWLRQGNLLLTSIIVAWGVGVAFSRVWLGMHSPADLMASLMSAIALNLLVPNISLPPKLTAKLTALRN